MFNLMAQGAAMLSQPDVIIALIAGTLGGMFIGAMPGLSASMAVALLIPVTFGMSGAAGITLLVAVYTSAIYGGSITACLLHTPGTPASAATAADGFALTKQGKGLKAIGVSTAASMIGGTISAIALLFIAPALSQVALKFSSLEYFLIGVFGLTIIGSLAGDNMMKGLLSGCLGLMIGCIGLDIQSSAPRYCFSILELQSGIQLVPAMIGLFSLSQVMFSIEDVAKGKHTVLDENAKNLTGSPVPTWKDFKPLIPTIAQSSIIGVLVGILPGAGGDIGSWISYNTAKNSSKHPEEFGHGSLVGIAASETANNAVTGGALIPLLTLGIPGSGVAAIMLGGLMIKGLTPGYKLFSDPTTGPIVYCIILAFALANVLMGVAGLGICKQVVKISTIPMTILAPMIVALSTVGSYAVRQSIFDVWVMLVFGFIGYFMRKYGFATAPVVLAMILGPIAESNWRQTLTITKRTGLLEYFWTRPISIALVILIIIALFSPAIMKVINRKAAPSDPNVLADTAHED